MTAAVYCARWVLPVDSPPIEDGEVVVEDGIIAEVRRRSSAVTQGRREFGDAVLIPGLVNAHSHLEYTVLRGFLEDVPFFPWVRALQASKAALNEADWLPSARLGVAECLAGGVTTIGDNTDFGVTLQAAGDAGMRAVIFQELFGIDHRDLVEPIVQALDTKIRLHRAEAAKLTLGDLSYAAGDIRRLLVGVSPHALYTIRPLLFRAIADYTSREGLPTSIHIAESPAESELTEHGLGPFAEMFARRGIEWEAPHVSPTRYALSQGALGQRALAVHCVHQTPADIALLAESGAAIVHCPKSNAKLGAGIAPLAAWLATPGLRVALGTDSAVSNNTQDLFEEMRMALLMQRARQCDPAVVTAAQVVHMATMGGAAALGLEGHIGSLARGKRADMVAVRLDRAHTTPATDPYAALVYSARADDVAATMVDGRILYENERWTTMNVPSVIAAVRSARARLAARQE